MRRSLPGSDNRGALDGEDFTPHSPLRVSSNGLRLSGRRRPVRCSRGLGGAGFNDSSDERQERDEKADNSPEHHSARRRASKKGRKKREGALIQIRTKPRQGGAE